MGIARDPQTLSIILKAVGIWYREPFPRRGGSGAQFMETEVGGMWNVRPVSENK